MLIRSDIRDGKPFAITRPEDMDILAGVSQALETLRQTGFLLIVVTHQPAVATGKQQKTAVAEVNRRLQEALEIDAFTTGHHSHTAHSAGRKL